MSKPSAKAIRALKIISEKIPRTPREFAEYMWPRTDPHYKLSWDRVHNCGVNGATSGAPMWMLGGRYLSYLDKQGLISYGRNYNGYGYFMSLTFAGREALDAATPLHERPGYCGICVEQHDMSKPWPHKGIG